MYILLKVVNKRWSEIIKCLKIPIANRKLKPCVTCNFVEDFFLVQFTTALFCTITVVHVFSLV